MEPWEREPNEVDFEHEGMPCRLRRGPGGLSHWCGYVGVPAAHPFWGLDYSQPAPKLNTSPESALDVHGGVTYAGDHAPMCEPDGYWYFGFDCAHAGDLVPGMVRRGRERYGVYRDVAFVEAECRKLAEQLYRIAEQEHAHATASNN